MTGRRHRMDSIGSGYEKSADLLLSRVASMVRVPREEDFGIDFYCHPKSPSGSHTETVTDLAGLQIKGERVSLKYGGLDEHGNWRKHEFTWLMSLATPIYLVNVASDQRTCEVFSLAPLWSLFLKQSVYPFEVTFSTRPISTVNDWKLTQPLEQPAGLARGDGVRWTLDVGPPILRLSVDDPNDLEFNGKLATVLRIWIANDRANLMRFQQAIPVLVSFTNWRTNSIDGIIQQVSQHWSATPGKNLNRLCQTAEPLIVNMGIHLKAQDDRAAYAFVPVLQWLESREQLGGIGRGLLAQLVEAQKLGLSPSAGSAIVEHGVEASPSPACDEEDTNQSE